MSKPSCKRPVGWRWLALCALLFCPACIEEPAPGNTVITIGALLPLTGDWATAGQAAAAAVQAGAAEANNVLASIAATTRIAVRIEDTGTDRDTAADRLQALRSAGVTLVVGPFSEEATVACTALAERIGSTLISPASITDTLAGSVDPLWRMIPPASRQATSWQAVLADDGIDVLAPCIRADLDGTVLTDALAETFTGRGGIILNVTTYDIRDTKGNDFRQTLDQLDAVLDDALTDFDSSRVAVLVAGFDEIAALLAQATDRSTAGAVRWYAAGPAARNPRVTDDDEAASLAARVSLTSLGIGQGDDAQAEPVIDALTELLQRAPDPHALATFDAVLLAALSADQARVAGGGATAADFLPAVASVYRGATGTTSFDAWGDRLGTTLDVWTVTEDESGPAWARVDQVSGETVTPIPVPGETDGEAESGG